MDEGRPRPRLWPTLIACIGILPLILATSVAIAAPVMLVYAASTGTKDQQEIVRWFESFSESVPGLVVALLPVEAMLVLVALALAAFSPTPWRERLALRSPRLGPASVALVLLGSVGVLLAVQIASDALIEEPSKNIQWITRVMTKHDGAAAVVVALLLSLPPGFAEELFFRGYVQTRLAERWPAWAAILVAAVSFAILHFDPQHSALVLPMGVWLGFLAWATSSVWTSMLAHATINAVAFVLARLFGDLETGEIPPGPAYYGAVAVGLLATALCTLHLLLRRQRAARPAAAAALE